MRILYIVQYYTGPDGTGLIRHYENPRRLVQMGHQVTLLCGVSDRASSQDVADGRAAGIDIRQAPIRFYQQFSWMHRIINFQRFIRWAIDASKGIPRPDVVYASSAPLTVGEIGYRIAERFCVPFVFEVRDLWPEAPLAVGALKNPLLRWSAYRMARKAYNKAAHVVVLSPDARDVVVGNWGVPADHITVIPNCSDTDRFGSCDGRQEERASRGWENQLVCIHPGAMGLVNGLDYLLDCAKVLDARGIRNIHIALLGKGAQREHLAERVTKESIQSATIYDAVRWHDMPRLLAAADVGLVSVLPRPYLETNSACKLFDFLAAGLPVVINYAGWQAKMLQERDCGLSVDPHDPRTLADALCTLRDDPARRGAMGNAARRLAEEQFNRRLLVDRLEGVLRQVVSEPSQPPAVFGQISSSIQKP